MTPADLDRINTIIAPLLGQRAWNVEQGWSSFITLEFGEPQVKILTYGKPPTQHRHTSGEWHLWIYNAEWRLEEGERVLAASMDADDHIAPAVTRMNSLALLQVEVIPPAFDTIFTFEQDVVLRLFSAYSYDMEQWMLFVPDGHVLTLGPGTMWSYHMGSETRPPDYVVPLEPTDSDER